MAHPRPYPTAWEWVRVSGYDSLSEVLRDELDGEDSKVRGTIDDSIVLEQREVEKKITQISESVHVSSLFRTFTYWPPRSAPAPAGLRIWRRERCSR